jgi:lysylphosphatidylglycerol synthetase-like protein (DUF2156 family)
MIPLPPRREVAAFCLRFAAILAVYLLPWAPIADAYAGVAVAVANATVGADAGDLRLEFTRPDAHDEGGIEASFTVELRATDVPRNTTVRLALDLRSLAYVPTAVFIALAVAAPIWQRRRGLYVLGLGLVLLHAFFTASLALTVVLFLAQPVPLQVVHLSRGTALVFDILHRVFVSPPGMAIAVPAFVWLALLWVVPRPHRPEQRSDALVSPA